MQNGSDRGSFSSPILRDTAGSSQHCCSLVSALLRSALSGCPLDIQRRCPANVRSCEHGVHLPGLSCKSGLLSHSPHFCYTPVMFLTLNPAMAVTFTRKDYISFHIRSWSLPYVPGIPSSHPAAPAAGPGQNVSGRSCSPSADPSSRQTPGTAYRR